MLKQDISTSTGKPVQRLCLSLGAEAVALFKAVAEIQKVSPEECFVSAMRPYVLSLVEHLAQDPNSDIELLSELEHAINDIFVNIQPRFAA